MNLMTAAKEMHDKNMEFSKKAEEELKVFLNAVTEILDLSVTAFENNDVKKASLVEPLEEVIDDLNTCVKANHIKRLQKGKCTIEQGFVLSDISTNLERVSDHCSNIAISVIEIDRDGFDAHGYLENLKRDDDPRFQGMVESYRKKYTLPVSYTHLDVYKRQPFHLYDEKGIRENARALKEAFSWNPGFKEYFAVKATPNPFILKILQDMGCGTDCSSETELMLSKACGFTGHDLSLIHIWGIPAFSRARRMKPM